MQLISGGRCWRYAQLEGEVARWEALLAARGVQPGDRVALLSPNRPEWVAILFAAIGRRAVLVPLNTRLTRSELGAQLALAKPTLVLADDALSARVEGAVALGAVRPVDMVGAPSPWPALDTPVVLMFTSGTTGRAKAVQLSLGNLQASARASRRHFEEDQAPVWLACLPLFHVGGVAMVFRALESGGTLVLHDGFDPEAVNRALDEGVTHVSLVAASLQRLLELRGNRRFSTRLRVALIGGGPVSDSLICRARELGMPAFRTYGLTEAASQVTSETSFGASAGTPLPGTEVRVVDANRRPLPCGAVGEIEVRGPTVMLGYFDDQASTQDSLSDGWLRTRDLGSIDANGQLTVHARRTDLIVSGGENIYPAEIESVLAAHPAVADSVVIPIEDDRWGQRPIALVVTRGQLDAEALEAWCRAQLAGFKVPAQFIATDLLPRNATGKVNRVAAREWFKSRRP